MGGLETPEVLLRLSVMAIEDETVGRIVRGNAHGYRVTAYDSDLVPFQGSAQFCREGHAVFQSDDVVPPPFVSVTVPSSFARSALAKR